MTIVIDNAFSVYRLVERVNTRTMLRHRRTMSLVSYEIENATLIGDVHNRIFSGFQRLSKFLPQMERYREIAAKSESVHIFGIPDIEPPPIENITYVHLSLTDQLAREWFLVSYGPDYFSSLATEEMTHIDDADDERMFKGLWSFDLNIVQILHEWLANAVDLDPEMWDEKIEQQGRNYARQIELMSRSLTRITDRQEEQNAKPEPVAKDVSEELDTTAAKELKPALDMMASNFHSR